MKHLILCLIISAVCSTASAQLAPPTGQVYFVADNEAELLVIRAAATHGFHFQSLAHGGSGFPNADAWTSPHNEGGWDDKLVGPPHLCADQWIMESYTQSEAWNDGFYQYLGGCWLVDGASECVPEIETLVDVQDLSSACKTELVLQYCGPLDGEWALDMCNWGQLYCCAP